MWEILGEQRVFINACSIDSDDQPVYMDITLNEPSIVAAFVDYYESLWQRIAQEHRDKWSSPGSKSGCATSLATFLTRTSRP